MRREALLRGGAVLDRAAELFFRLRHAPHGLLHERTEVTAERLDLAVLHGSRFLERHQNANGSWRGFLLYPGASTVWLTAHVAFVLEDVARLERSCRKAAEFLHAIGADDGGWGFNRRVAVDSDSWAQALLVLSRFSLPTEEFLVRNLAARQLPCGAFPTYRSLEPTGTPVNGWQAAHPEVSAIVAEALHRAGGFDPCVERCRQWLARGLSRGVLASYWWSGDYYALWLQTRLALLTRSACTVVKEALRDAAASPQLPMALTAAVELGLPRALLVDAARSILAGQFADGSWKCAPCLRVTSPECFAARSDAPGFVAADRCRVFSTAHAVAALARVRNRLFAPVCAPTAGEANPPGSPF